MLEVKPTGGQRDRTVAGSGQNGREYNILYKSLFHQIIVAA